MKLLIFILTITFLFMFKTNAFAETKRDCSMYSTKTFSGLSNKMRCKKGLPERESFFGKLKLKKNTSGESFFEKKKSCDEYTTKTITGLIGKLKCK